MWLVDAHCTAKNDDLSLHYIIRNHTVTAQQHRRPTWQPD